MFAEQASGKISLYYLLPPNGIEQTGDEMKMAFQDCLESDLNPQWINNDDAMKLKVKTDVIVIEHFEGKVFEKLKKEKCVRICGPRCIRTCLAEGTQIPEINSPIYMTAMKGLIVTATNVSSAVKMEIKEKVSYMGGIYVSNLIESVTHMVCGTVRSVKYDKAAERNVTFMTKDWISAVWDKGLERNIHATDDEFQKYKCPIFYNLEITTTNLSNAEKNNLKQLINSNGGIYSGELKQSSTSILIINDNPSTSKKYQHARSWDLPCLTSSWVYESLEKGYAVGSQNHVITPKVRCSTPTKNKEELPSFSASDISMVSTIPYGVQPNASHVDESAAVFSNTTVFTSQNFKTTQKKPGSDDSYKKVIESLNVAEAKAAGPFLDGCNVYLSGFTTNEQDKLRRILNLGGAVIFSELSDAVSHVVAGHFVGSDASAICRAANKPHVVTVDWLAASIKLRSPAAESQYLRTEAISNTRLQPEPPSPLSQKGMQLLMKNKEFKTPPAIEKGSGKKRRENAQSSSTGSSNSDLHTKIVNRNLFEDFLKDAAAPESSKSSTTSENQPAATKTPVAVDNLKNANESSADTSNMTSEGPSEMFKDLDFMILGFDTDITSQIEELIYENGGRVVQQTFKGMTDYTVVPVCGFSFTGIQSEVITTYWLDDCKMSKSVLPVQYYHQPISIAGNRTPLEGCVITLSIYAFMERQYLSDLAGALGALCQQTFVRKTNPAKGIQGNTHLVIPSSGSTKYNAAVKWNIPVVTKDWMLSCAKHGTRVPETPFLVTDTESCKDPGQEQSTSKKDLMINKENAVSTPLGANSKSNSSTKLETPSTTRVISLANENTPNSSKCDLRPSATDTPMDVVAKNLSECNYNSPKVRKMSLKLMTSTPVNCGNYEYDSTPDTPYEKLFAESGKNARKRIKRWMDRCDADKDEMYLPAPKRRDSTPLSELMKKAFRKFGNTPDNSCDESDKSIESKSVMAEESSKECESKDTPVSDKKSKSSLAETLNKINKRLSTPIGGSSSLHQRIAACNISPAVTVDRERIDVASSSSSAESNIKSNFNYDSQKYEIGWEEPIESAEKAKVLGLSSDSSNSPRERKFVLSNVQEENKNDYLKMINSLGATLLRNERYTDEMTHLLTERPVRSEKLLCSIAAGKWVLHISYLEKSYKANIFLPEEDFEWGNPRSKENINPLSSEREILLAKAAFRWRYNLQTAGTKDTGAYNNMKAVLLCNNKKLSDNLSRLISAGKGILLDEGSILEASHCFIDDPNHPAVNNKRVNFEILASRNIYCLNPVYLSDFLTSDPIPNPADNVIENFKKYIR